MADVAPTLVSIITCPQCGHAAAETMPTDACQFFYDCRVLWHATAAEARRLLRFLLIWQRAVSAEAAAGRQPLRPPPTLPTLMPMTSGRIGWFMSWLSVIALVLTVAMPAVEIGHIATPGWPRPLAPT